MPTDIFMPRLGLTMEEGTIIRWLAAGGDRVTQGQPLLEVETDKVTVEVEAPATGIMANPLVGAGQKVAVGVRLGLILETEESLRLAQDDHWGRSERGVAWTTSRARHAAEQANVDPAVAAANAPGGRITAEERRASSHQARDAGRVFASPRARKRARERGLDWRNLTGSGPRGRVIERDVLHVMSEPPPAGGSDAPPAIPPAREEAVQWEAPAAAQSVATERMTASFGSAPHFYLDVEVQADPLLALRDRLRPVVQRKAGVRLTITDVLIRIVGAALAEHPRVNAYWEDGRAGRDGQVNVGVAVAIGASEQPGTGTGLLAPVLWDADRKPLAQIAAERAALMARARAGQLSQSDMDSRVFTLANLGMHRVDSFHAIFNPPRAAMPAVGRIAERPVALGGQLAVRQTVVLTLSCDHRVLDGLSAAQFLGHVAALIENPYDLLA